MSPLYLFGFVGMNLPLYDIHSIGNTIPYLDGWKHTWDKILNIKLLR